MNERMKRLVGDYSTRDAAHGLLLSIIGLVPRPAPWPTSPPSRRDYRPYRVSAEEQHRIADQHDIQREFKW